MPTELPTPLGYAGPRMKAPRDAPPRPPGVQWQYVVLYLVLAGLELYVIAANLLLTYSADAFGRWW